MKTFTVCLFLFLSANLFLANDKIKLGVDVFLSEAYKTYEGKKIGLITNSSGVTSELESNIDAFHNLSNINLVKLFGPEHGIRGDVYAGGEIENSADTKTGIPVYSLYGKYKKPSKDMLEGLDVLIYDIQDIDNRTYTYIYTMAYAMQAAAENDIEFIVLDRPIAMYGNLVDGNILDPEFSSFIGLYPIPYIYGMTPGELAMLFNKEFDINAKLTIVKMEGYNHEMDFDDTGLSWIPTSPHIPRSETPYYCAATGNLGELGTVCVGVGYTLPFELVGEEWMDGNKLAEELNSRKLPGIYFRPVNFKPFYTNFKDRKCRGVQLIINNRKVFKPFLTSIHIATAIQKLFPDSNFLESDRKTSFDKAAGTDKIRKLILEGKSATEIVATYEKDLEQFLEIRKKYLLYN